MVVGIEHTAIASPDPQKLAQWYVETLGFVINYNSGKTVFLKAPNGTMIEIITAEGDAAPKNMKDPGLRHMALTVSDYEAAYAELKAKAVSFVGEPILNQEVKVVFFKDPEGNFLHIIQRLKPLA
jgi:glyoxylase I family protein